LSLGADFFIFSVCYVCVKSIVHCAVEQNVQYRWPKKGKPLPIYKNMIADYRQR